MQRRSDWSEENGWKKSSRHNSHSRWHSLSRLDYWKIHDRSMVTYVNCDFLLPSIDFELMMAERIRDGENLMKFSVTRPSFHTALFIEFQWGNLIIHGLSQPRWSSDDSMIQFLNIITSWRNFLIRFHRWRLCRSRSWFCNIGLNSSCSFQLLTARLLPSLNRPCDSAASEYCNRMKISNLILVVFSRISSKCRMKLWKNKN